MAETSSEKRIEFQSPGDQRDFFRKVGDTFEGGATTWLSCAQTLGVSPRTLLAWRRADNLMTQSAAEKLCDLTGLKLPFHTLKPLFWSVTKASKLGGEAVMRKYGRVPINQEKRRKNWQKWWSGEGKKLINIPIGKTKPVTLPPRSPETAEWAGIVSGDGGMTKYQITITSHSEDDRQYQEFLTKFINQLFNLTAATTFVRNAKAVNTKISRKLLVDYCVSKLGLVIGNKVKQGFGVPEWIKKGSQKIITSYLRGLFDTDGSVYRHTYTVNNKSYSYTKLAFTSASLKLVDDIYELLAKVGIKSRVTKNYRDVVIDSKEMAKKYFETVGTHNPKHLKRYRSQPILNQAGEVA